MCVPRDKVGRRRFEEPRRNLAEFLLYWFLFVSKISAESEEADNGHAVLVGSDFAGARGEPSKNGL